MQAFTLLVAGGYAHPMLPEGGTAAGREAARRLNLAIAQANANAADLPRLGAPAIGSAVGGDILETLVVGELLAGKPRGCRCADDRTAGGAGPQRAQRAARGQAGHRSSRDRRQIVTDAVATIWRSGCRSCGG